MVVHAIYQLDAIEDFHSAIVAIARTSEGAQKWIQDKVERSQRLTKARQSVQETVETWKTTFPVPDLPPMPPQTRWPSGIGKNDPRYPELRQRREEENKLLAEWHALCKNLFAPYHSALSKVEEQAWSATGLSEKERKAAENYYGPAREMSEYEVREMETVD